MLLVRLRERYGDRIEMVVIDASVSIWFFDFFRYRIRADQVTWVMDGKVLFRGVPAWEEIEAALRQRLEPREE
jgi:hypothetical protein